jgi:hypothetical protein
VDTLQDGREPAFLIVAGNDVVGCGQRVERALISEDAVVEGRRVEQVVVLAHGWYAAVPPELRVCMWVVSDTHA